MILTMTGKLQPLDEKFQIAGPDGRPTLYFTRWAQQRMQDIGDALSREQVLALIQEFELQSGLGITITPDGKLTSDPTIAVDIQAVLDAISAVQGSVLYRGASDWEALAPGTAGEFLQTNGAGADPAWAAGGGGGGGGGTLLPYFGDGSDGDVTISAGVTNLTRDMYYNNLTLSGTGQINTSGYKIFVKGILDISAAGAAAIFAGATLNLNRNGGNASLSSGGGTGNTGTGTRNTLGNPPSAPTAGANGGTGAGAQAGLPITAGDVIAPGHLSGAGGAGGAVGATAGGASRAAGTISSTFDVRTLRTHFATEIATYALIRGGSSGPGGSSGAGDGVGTGGGGGGGGAGGFIMLIAAATINRGASTAAAAIQARGGNGGNGASGNGGVNRGGGGGGAGGGGGWIYLIYETLTGATATNCLDATGGNGGNGGNGVGTGNGGNGGGSGSGGRIQVFDLGSGTQTVTSGAASVAGGAAVGSTGGTGATAVTNAVNL
jgi:hypothetical protein